MQVNMAYMLNTLSDENEELLIHNEDQIMSSSLYCG
jgi:hypothetical protein